MIIGSDIGGVVKYMTSDEVIYQARESIEQLIQKGHQLIFISKCKERMESQLRMWLVENGFGAYPVYFCREYNDKAMICQQQHVDMKAEIVQQVNLCQSWVEIIDVVDDIVA